LHAHGTRFSAGFTSASLGTGRVLRRRNAIAHPHALFLSTAHCLHSLWGRLFLPPTAHPLLSTYRALAPPHTVAARQTIPRVRVAVGVAARIPFVLAQELGACCWVVPTLHQPFSIKPAGCRLPNSIHLRLAASLFLLHSFPRSIETYSDSMDAIGPRLQHSVPVTKPATGLFPWATRHSGRRKGGPNNTWTGCDHSVSNHLLFWFCYNVNTRGRGCDAFLTSIRHARFAHNATLIACSRAAALLQGDSHLGTRLLVVAQRTAPNRRITTSRYAHYLVKRAGLIVCNGLRDTYARWWCLGRVPINDVTWYFRACVRSMRVLRRFDKRPVELGRRCATLTCAWRVSVGSFLDGTTLRVTF